MKTAYSFVPEPELIHRLRRCELLRRDGSAGLPRAPMPAEETALSAPEDEALLELLACSSPELQAMLDVFSPDPPWSYLRWRLQEPVRYCELEELETLVQAAKTAAAMQVLR